MDLKEIVSVSGMGGLFKVIAQRPDGLIVQNFDEDRSKFVSNRSHMFTPLDGITIYTEEDHAELTDVLTNMKKLEKEHPVVAPKASSEDLKAYFAKVLPDYDEEKVYTSDIKKIVKWYAILDEQGLLTIEEKKKETKASKKKGKKAEATEEVAKDQAPAAEAKPTEEEE